MERMPTPRGFCEQPALSLSKGWTGCCPAPFWFWLAEAHMAGR